MQLPLEEDLIHQYWETVDGITNQLSPENSVAHRKHNSDLLQL